MELILKEIISLYESLDGERFSNIIRHQNFLVCSDDNMTNRNEKGPPYNL